MRNLEEMNLEWFDKKYRDGQNPTLEDRAHLFAELDIPLPDRTRNRIEDYLKVLLFKFNKNTPYSQSIHVLTYALLFDFAPLLKLDPQKYEKYVRLYRQAEEKHKEEIALKRNFG